MPVNNLQSPRVFDSKQIDMRAPPGFAKSNEETEVGFQDWEGCW